MNKKPIYYAQAVLIFVVIIGAGCWQSNFNNTSYQTQVSTGSFGRYEFDGPKAVQDFNLQAKEWFTERGFVEIDNEKYYDVISSDAGAENWDKPGVLLLSKLREQRSYYIFIPDRYHPEENYQRIGFQIKLKGTNEEVQEYRDDFDKLKNDFTKKFPPDVVVRTSVPDSQTPDSKTISAE